MKKLFIYADEYLKQSSWKDLALIKFCLCAMGVIIGMALPKKAHKPAAFITTAVFAGTYVPLMLKLFKVISEKEAQEN